ncbi:hypothetical protein JCM3770_002885 [Rhodotorula araucariae]
MPVWQLVSRQLQLADSNLTKLPTLSPAASVASSLARSGGLPSPVQLTTVTVLETIYLAAPSLIAAVNGSAPSSATSEEAPSALASNLAAYATDSHDGLSLVQLGGAFASALLALVVLICAVAFFLRKAAQMRRLLEQSDDEALSDVGLGGGGGGFKWEGETRGQEGGRASGEQRGLMRARSERTDTTSDSSDGDGDVKL